MFRYCTCESVIQCTAEYIQLLLIHALSQRVTLVAYIGWLTARWQASISVYQAPLWKETQPSGFSVSTSTAEQMTRTQLVLHQFITGIPAHVSKQLRVTGKVGDLDKVLERAQLLLTIEKQRKSAAIEAKEGLSKVEALREQISALTEQVAAHSISCNTT